MLSQRIERSAGGVVVGPDGRIVLTYKKKKGASFPKGHVDPGETSEQAARREITEESGISDLTMVCRLGSFIRRTKGLRFKRIELYLYRTAQADLSPTDRKHTAKWHSPDEAYLRLRADRPVDAKQIPKHRARINRLRAEILNTTPPRQVQPAAVAAAQVA
jgi:8-oxo-dGTP pyrophosphatase MutT (NUDIX family)